MAEITITGNIAAPELKWTSGGKAVLNLSVADTPRRKNPATNEWEDGDTTWWRVQVWERAAETLAEVLNKGDRVLITGTVAAREWQDRDGAKRISYDVTARHVGTIPKARRTEQRPQQPQGGDPWASAGPSGFDQAPPF